jgi:hypothetical protein
MRATATSNTRPTNPAKAMGWKSAPPLQVGMAMGLKWIVKIAYRNLESEKDAFAVEDLVKKAFDAQAAVAPKPTPSPTKKN